jgi:AraC family transcriptional regulator
VTLTSAVAFNYSWNGATNYLALHDLQLTDGLAFLESREPQRKLDLRNRITFAPPGATIEGWSALSGDNNSFTAIFFRPDLLQTELGSKAPSAPTKPALYFYDEALLAWMAKLRVALISQQHVESAYVETLTLVCALELARLSRVVDYRDEPPVGRLARKVAERLREYIAANLHREITLEELAASVELSRFHFIRAFKRSFGATPHQFLIMERVTRATQLLVQSKLSLSQIASAAGFTSPQQFSTAFQNGTGIAPGQFRRRLK